MILRPCSSIALVTFFGWMERAIFSPPASSNDPVNLASSAFEFEKVKVENVYYGFQRRRLANNDWRIWHCRADWQVHIFNLITIINSVGVRLRKVYKAF
jgi:hypothetical protein